MSIYYVPPINLLGKGCLNEAKDSIKSLGTKKAFIVSDKFLVSNGTVKKVTDILSQIDVDFVVYDEVKQNPTVTNVNKGLKILKSENCDFVITIGGGSPQDWVKLSLY